MSPRARMSKRRRPAPTSTRSRTARDTLVFVGPTLRADDVRALVPDGTVLPPAAVGDILRAAHDKRVGRIALIDGYFERMAAVWHKEILVALARGIEVWGAASMGALRAAELHPFGMRGVGAIYDWFKRGSLLNDDILARTGRTPRTSHGEPMLFATADDEVAVAHLPAEYGYRAVSDALVNIRFNIQLETGHMLKSLTAERLVSLARARFYRERTWATLFADARAAKLPESELAPFEQKLKTDRKAADALELLVRLQRTPIKRARAERVPRTWALRQLERLVLR
jgi:hypothetical protein